MYGWQDTTTSFVQLNLIFVTSLDHLRHPFQLVRSLAAEDICRLDPHLLHERFGLIVTVDHVVELERIDLLALLFELSNHILALLLLLLASRCHSILLFAAATEQLPKALLNDVFHVLVLLHLLRIVLNTHLLESSGLRRKGAGVHISTAADEEGSYDVIEDDIIQVHWQAHLRGLCCRHDLHCHVVQGLRWLVTRQIGLQKFAKLPAFKILEH